MCGYQDYRSAPIPGPQVRDEQRGGRVRATHEVHPDSDRRPFPTTGSLTFEPVAEGTKSTWVFKVQPGGFFALAEPLFARSLKRQLETALGDAKDLLESQAAQVSS